MAESMEHRAWGREQKSHLSSGIVHRKLNKIISSLLLKGYGMMELSQFTKDLTLKIVILHPAFFLPEN
jgi:hypothetical protein